MLKSSPRGFMRNLDPTTGEWDAADLIPTGHMRNDPWKVKEPENGTLDQAASATWNALPDDNKAWLKVTGIIPFGNIVAIDDMGDDIVTGTHIYVPFTPNKGPFDYFFVNLETVGFGDPKQWGDMDPKTRVVKFPAQTRKRPKPAQSKRSVPYA
jgi:hypothetical protein